MSDQIKKEHQNEVVTKEKLIEYLRFNGINTLTNNELGTFIEIAKQFNLNPFKKEIYAIKYGSNFNLIVGFEVYIKRAERSGLLDGWSVTSDKDKATITIYRKDRKFAFIHEVFLSEYAQQTKIWKEKPLTMLKKVAISQGFRLCFSDELGGIPYTAEEIVNQDIAYESIELQKTNTVEFDALKLEFMQLLEHESLAQDKDRIWSKIDSINLLQLTKGIDWAKGLIVEFESKL